MTLTSFIVHTKGGFAILRQKVACANSAPTAAPSSTKGATARSRSGCALAGAAMITTWEIKNYSKQGTHRLK